MDRLNLIFRQSLQPVHAIAELSGPAQLSYHECADIRGVRWSDWFMQNCDKCGREKIVVKNAITGFPNHYISGTKREYCGVCDTPPEIELVVGDHQKLVLVGEDEA